MFSRIGLFDAVPCPEKSRCKRSQCPFSHSPDARHTAIPHVPHAPPVQRTLQAQQPQAGPSRKTPSIVPNRRPNALTVTPYPISKNVEGNEPPRKVQRLGLDTSTSTSKVSTARVATNSSGVPVIRVNAALSQVAIPVRQTMLKTLYDHFVNLYSDLLESNPSLPAEHALAQEEEVYSKSSKLTYRNAIIQSVGAIKKRTKPTSINHDSVGTDEMIKQRHDNARRLRNLRLSEEHLRPYVMTSDEMKKWGYIVEIPEGQGSTEPNQVGKTKQCDRCNQHYLVKSGDEVSKSECRFHWGRPYTNKINGEKVRLYKCCFSEYSESEGCDKGPHVFSESDPVLLHARHAFTHTRSATSDRDDTALDVVALDCEMIYSTGGVRVARVSVVDGCGTEILDEIIRMDKDVEVIDFNTRFSGVTEESYSKSILTLASVRRALDEIISSKTIIVGHALENDLRTLRMIHHNCVDTVVLYPHRAGPPYRRALRDLAREHLDRGIQMGGSAVGHSSVEDSVATLDLVRQFILNKATVAPVVKKP